MAGTARLLEVAKLAFMLLVVRVGVAAGEIRINVNYPVDGSVDVEDGNFSIVVLTCDDGFGSPLQGAPAEFQLNDTDIEDIIVGVMPTGETNQIRFSFSQSQEGTFSCEHESSAEEGRIQLAASPATNYEGKTEDRYFIIRSEAEPVNLSCAIQPGALEERYTVGWRRSSRNVLPFKIDETSFNISQTVSPSTPTTFMCTVEIEHKPDVDRDYDGPRVTVHTKVPSTLANDSIDDSSVAFGEPANFSCGIVEGDTDFDLLWRIGQSEYRCDDSEMDSDIKCKTNGSVNVLHIENNATVGGGTHQVQCVMRPRIEPNYRSDPLFEPKFAEDVVRIATLMVIGGPVSTTRECLAA